ncbi:hypothetical protein N9W84_00690 [bacterium]|nr:hypothetical protein [bacterium]
MSKTHKPIKQLGGDVRSYGEVYDSNLVVEADSFGNVDLSSPSDGDLIIKSSLGWVYVTDIYVEASTSVSLNDSEIFHASGSTAASGTLVVGDLTFPASDGTDGQFLVTDGSGSLSFSSVSSGSASASIIPKILSAEQSSTGYHYVDANSSELLFINGTGFTLSTEVYFYKGTPASSDIASASNVEDILEDAVSGGHISSSSTPDYYDGSGAVSNTLSYSSSRLPVIYYSPEKLGVAVNATSGGSHHLLVKNGDNLYYKEDVISFIYFEPMSFDDTSGGYTYSSNDLTKPSSVNMGTASNKIIKHNTTFDLSQLSSGDTLIMLMTAAEEYNSTLFNRSKSAGAIIGFGYTDTDSAESTSSVRFGMSVSYNSSTGSTHPVTHSLGSSGGLITDWVYNPGNYWTMQPNAVAGVRITSDGTSNGTAEIVSLVIDSDGSVSYRAVVELSTTVDMSKTVFGAITYESNDEVIADNLKFNQ